MEGQESINEPIDGAFPEGQNAASDMTATDALPDGLLSAIDGVREMVVAGGPVVAILIALSVAALGIVFVKLWQFRRMRLGDRAPARRALTLHQAGKTDEALLLLKGARNPVAQVLGRAIRGQRRGVAEPKIREEVVRYGVELRPDGLRLSGESLELEALAARVAARLAAKPDQRVLVKPAPGVVLQRAVMVLDRLTAAGARDLSLIRDPGAGR